MSAVLPDPPELELPDENPHALDDAVTAIAGAAFQLGVLGAHLEGPAATAPGWLGDDAAAAAAQVGAVAGVARDAHQALDTATGRLRRHADLLETTRRAIARLRSEQQEEYAAAAARLADVLLHPAVPTAPQHPAAVVVLGDELRTANAARQRRHGALLAELRADAVDTARVLVAAAAAVGGTGRPGDGVRVFTTLAGRLPGWGDGELSARAAELARELLGPGTREELESRAAAALPYAGTEAFADALLRVLGPDGLRLLVYALPVQGLGADSATARLLALALGGARRTGAVVDPVGEVLDATYVHERTPGIDDDLVALGLATVLAAAAPTGPGAISAATASRWGGQVMRREQWWRSITPAADGARDRAGAGYATAPDPVDEVIRFLGAAGDPAAAAAVVPDVPSWDLLVKRPELAVSDSQALSRFVELVGEHPGPDGDAAVRAGLDALAAGMADEDPNHWQVARQMADVVSFPLAAGLAKHPDVLSGVLLAATDGTQSTTDRAALRALGYVSLDPGATSTLDASIAGWAREHANVVDSSSVLVAPQAVGSFVAVRQYGQRLAYALHGFEVRDAAKAAEKFWNLTVGLLVNLAPGKGGVVGGILEPFAAHVLGYDGTWDNGQDTGLVFDPGEAAAVAEVELGGGPGGATGALGATAAGGFLRAGGILGMPLPPTSPEWIWWQALIDAIPGPELPRKLAEQEIEQLLRGAH